MDRKAELMVNLDWLDTALRSAKPEAVAGLVRERRQTLSELASVGAAMGTVRNDIAVAREKRRAAAAAAAQKAAGGGNKRSG